MEPEAEAPLHFAQQACLFRCNCNSLHIRATFELRFIIDGSFMCHYHSACHPRPNDLCLTAARSGR